MASPGTEDLAAQLRAQRARADELENKLLEANDLLEAIRNGDVDAFVTDHLDGSNRVYTLTDADRPYRLLIEQMREGAMTLSDDGTILFANASLLELLGATSGTLLAHRFERFVLPQDRAAWHALLRHGGAGQLSVLTPAGASIVRISMSALTSDSANRRISCAIVTDLTEAQRRDAELALERERAAGAAASRESEERLKFALRAGRLGSWDLDLTNWTLSASELCKTNFGRAPADAFSYQDLLSSVHPEDAARMRAAVASAIQSRSDYDIEYRVVGLDGLTRWVHVRGQSMYDAEGVPLRMAGVSLDITPRRLADEALQDLNANLEAKVLQEVSTRVKAEDALRQSQKMEAVGQLTGGLAHDFNNLLAGIGSSLQMIKLRLQRGEIDTLARYAAMGEDGVKRAAALTQRLLAFSRRQTLDPTAADVNVLVAGMVDLIQRTVGPSIAIRVDLASSACVVKVDVSQLENSLLNLCINARDAMPAGGQLVIATESLRVEEGRPADPNSLASGAYVKLRVLDQGSGMAPEIAQRIFDPFFTTKPLGQGTGLGLSMVYGFVRQSGGLVEVHSALGEGTEMSILLPRFMGDSVPSVQAEHAALSLEGHGETILLVEDEKSIRTLVAERLVDAGYRVLTAEDGHSAFEQLKLQRQISLLVTDVGLPGGLNGRQVADAARVMHPGLPALFVTGFAEASVLNAGSLEQGMGILTKPFELDQLLQKVRAMIDGHAKNGLWDVASAPAPLLSTLHGIDR